MGSLINEIKSNVESAITVNSSPSLTHATYFTIEIEKYSHSSPALLEVEIQKLLPILIGNLISRPPV